MRAVVYTEYGSPSVLQLREVEKPVPKNKEMLVKVHASTVTAGATWIRKGHYPGSKLFTCLIRLVFGITKPKRTVLGFEFSGIVEDVGKDVNLFQIGDKVYGTTTGLKNGAYADYVCIPEKWKHGVVALKPGNITFKEAAALPIGGMTALQILMKAKMKLGDKLLVYGASGSIGTYAVQIAKYFDTTLTAVCNNANIVLVKSIGADEVVDYTKQDITQYKDRFDIIFDAVGKIKTSKLKPLLKRGGKFCSVKSLTNERPEYLDMLHKMISEGKLKPVIDREYSLEQIVEAHKYVDLGHKKGNVVINHK